MGRCSNVRLSGPCTCKASSAERTRSDERRYGQHHVLSWGFLMLVQQRQAKHLGLPPDIALCPSSSAGVYNRRRPGLTRPEA